VSASPVRLWSSTSGCGSASSPSRLIQTVRKPESRRRRDVVEEARADVDVPRSGRRRCERRTRPSAARGLVRADLGRDDGELELRSDPRDRRIQEVAIRVREARQPPAAGPASSSAAGTSGERRPSRAASAECVLLVRWGAEPGESDGHHLAIAPARVLALNLRLELVIRAEQLAGARSRRTAARARGPMPPFQSTSVP
jgi:hypothetical protein